MDAAYPSEVATLGQPANILATPGQAFTKVLIPDTLFLGDGNFTTIRVSYLTEKCKIQTVREANLNLMQTWVKEMLNWVPKTCIIQWRL